MQTIITNTLPTIEEVVMNANKISFKMRNAFIINPYEKKLLPDNYDGEPTEEEINSLKKAIIDFNAELNTMGYTINPDELFSIFSTQSLYFNIVVGGISYLQFFKDMINVVKESIGADVEYEPLWKGYPESIATADEYTILFTAMVHYATNGEFKLSPTVTKSSIIEDTMSFYNRKKPKLIKLINSDEFKEIFTNLMSSMTSLSAYDKDALKFYFNNIFETHINGYDIDKFPKIRFKETLCFVSGLLFNKLSNLEFDNLIANPTFTYLQHEMSTVTDILRFIAYISSDKNDISLATPPVFRKFTKNEVLTFMLLLSQFSTNKIVSEMIPYKEYWKRAGEYIHPHKANKYASDYNLNFTNVCEAFNIIRDNKKIKIFKRNHIPFNSQVEDLIKNKSWNLLMYLLTDRPTEYVKHLDLLLRESPDSKTVIYLLSHDMIKEVPTTTIISLHDHFMDRKNRYLSDESNFERSFIIKGNTTKFYVKEDDSHPIPFNCISQVITICENELEMRFTKRDFMGKVYIDEKLKSFCVPYNQRSASDTSEPIVRGSRFKLDKDLIIRPFLWWTNDIHDDRVDLDLSLAFLTDDYDLRTTLFYQNLKIPVINAYHSGDIINGGVYKGKGVAEFCDVDPESIIKWNTENKEYEKPIRYVLCTVHNFTGQDLINSIPCHVGVMEIPKDDKRVLTKDTPPVLRDPSSIPLSKVDTNDEVYNPEDVFMKMNINTKGNIVIPFIIDLSTMELIWIDTATGFNCTVNNAVTSLKKEKYMIKSVLNRYRTSMYDLIQMHAKTRGVQVSTREEANISFGLEEGDISPYELDKFMSEFM